MKDYLQPSFYRFNEDSILLSKFVTQRFSKIESLLDVGCGCGVIGIEIARDISVSELSLLEIQPEFLPFIESNITEFLPRLKTKVFNTSFKDFDELNTYKVITVNPPYYLPGSGEPSKDLNKGICRSFIKDSWGDLLSLFNRQLSKTGAAFSVIKRDKKIIEIIENEIKSTSLHFKIHELEKLYIVEFYFAD